MTARRKDSGIKFRALPVVAALTVTLVACNDNVRLPTGPKPSAPAASQLATGSVQSSDPLASRLSSAPGACLVSVRSPDGKYRSRSVTVDLPKQIAASSAATIQFAYRGWAAGVPQPTLVAWCNIPDSRSARTYFEKQFGGKSMNPAELRSFAQSVGVSGVEYWAAVGGPEIIQGAVTTYVADGLASESPATKSAPTGDPSAMLVPVCDPYADPPCDGTPEPEYVPVQPPPPTGVAADWRITGNPFPPFPSGLADIVCHGLSENPHKSTTANFMGRLNMKARSWCDGNYALPLSVSTVLGRYSCVPGRMCQWLQIALADFQGPKLATFIEAKSNTDCNSILGWYLGSSTHSFTYPGGYTVYGQTQSPWVLISCP